MTDCAICDHPAHDGRCPMPTTAVQSSMHNGLIFETVDTTGSCACGLVDSLIATGAAGV